MQVRQHAEQQFAEELHELKKNETNSVPENWGKIGRIEELTRIGSDVQDALITILS